MIINQHNELARHTLTTSAQRASRASLCPGFTRYRGRWRKACRLGVGQYHLFYERKSSICQTIRALQPSWIGSNYHGQGIQPLRILKNHLIARTLHLPGVGIGNAEIGSRVRFQRCG